MKKINVFLILALIFVLVASVAVNAQVSSGGSTIEMTLSNYDPIPAEPGKTAEVWIKIQNTGREDANNVRLEFIDTPVFSLISEEDRVLNLGTLGAQSGYIAKYKIKVADSAPEGENEILIKYSSGSNNLEIIGKIKIDVKSAETPISVNSIEISPAPLSPGGKATLTLKVDNIARSSNIRNVDVKLQITTITSATTIVDLPFVTVNSGNEQTIDRIAPGESAEFKFDIAAYPDAEAKIYKLPVTISYYDDTGREYEKTLLVGVEVNAKPDLLVTLESTDLNTKIKSGDVLFNIINKGTTNVKLMTITLEDSEGYSVLSPSNDLYLGNIDSDDFETARFNVETIGEGELTFVVKLTYKDALNNEFAQNYNVEYILREQAVQKKGSLMWVLLIIILVVVVVVWVRRRNRRKND
ncbi:MAG: COG1361 S-layer family protein [Candidatus Nanoarchaeia archaeon]